MCGNKMISIPKAVDRHIFELHSQIPNLSYAEAERVLENVILKNVDNRKTEYSVPISVDEYCDFIYGQMEDAVEAEKLLREMYG